MEWDFKMIPWDLAELEPNAEPAMGAVVRPDGCGLGQGTSMPDCSVDLKLGGGSGDFGQSERWKNQPRGGPAVPPATGSSKRARAPSNGGQVASCLVDGCKSDLSKCREYHRRHKVCEVHSKTQIVMVGGQEQRFCQQCSRFHLLVEFDEVKRSCRKRLDGHNRRRRKPQPDPLNSVSLFANHQGGRLTSFPPIFPTTSPGPNWPGMIKTEEEALYSNQQTMSFIGGQQTLPSSFSISFKDGKKFPFLQDGDTVLSSRTPLEATVCQPLPETVSSSERSSTKMFPDGMTTHVLDPKCALSLLSWPSQTAAINLGEMVPADRIPIGQPLVSSLAYSALGQYSDSRASSSVSPTGFSCSGMGDEHGGTVLVSDASDAEFHCHGIFHVGGEGSSAGASQALPFWQ